MVPEGVWGFETWIEDDPRSDSQCLTSESKRMIMFQLSGTCTLTLNPISPKCRSSGKRLEVLSLCLEPGLSRSPEAVTLRFWV